MVALLAALAADWAWGVGAAAPSGEAGPAQAPVLAQASRPAQPGTGNPDSKPVKEPWQERLERVERNRLIAVGVGLGVILLILLFWWGWGKIYHRPRKL